MTSWNCKPTNAHCRYPHNSGDAPKGGYAAKLPADLASHKRISLKKLSILIPVYNEAKTVVEVLDMVSKAPSEGLEKELVVVDDGSTDGTRDILRGIDP